MTIKPTNHSRDPQLVGGIALAIKIATTPTADKNLQEMGCDTVIAAFELFRAYVIQDLASLICAHLDEHPDFPPSDLIAILGAHNCDNIKTRAQRLELLVEAIGEYAKKDEQPRGQLN